MNDSKISYRGATYLLKGVEFPWIILANVNGIFEAMVLKSKIIMSSELSGRIVFLLWYFLRSNWVCFSLFIVPLTGLKFLPNRNKRPKVTISVQTLQCRTYISVFHLLQYSLRMINEEKAGMEFIYSMDSRTSCSPFKFHYPTINTASKCCHITVHTVTQSSPSPVISCVENVPQGARVSHITVTDSEHGHSTSSNESTTSKVLQDVHIVRKTTHIFLFLITI